MLALAAYRMGLQVAILEHGEGSPAGVMTKLEFPGGWSSRADLEAFARASDIITLENEFVSPELLRELSQWRPVYPTPETVALVRDKLTQKQHLGARWHSGGGVPGGNLSGGGGAICPARWLPDPAQDPALRLRWLREPHGGDPRSPRRRMGRAPAAHPGAEFARRALDSTLEGARCHGCPQP
jgi:hypothetical protein